MAGWRPRPGQTLGPAAARRPARRRPGRDPCSRGAVPPTVFDKPKRSKPSGLPLRRPLPISTPGEPKGWSTSGRFKKLAIGATVSVSAAPRIARLGDYGSMFRRAWDEELVPRVRGNAPNHPDSPGGPDGSWPPGPHRDCCGPDRPCRRVVRRSSVHPTDRARSLARRFW